MTTDPIFAATAQAERLHFLRIAADDAEAVGASGTVVGDIRSAAIKTAEDLSTMLKALVAPPASEGE